MKGIVLALKIVSAFVIASAAALALYVARTWDRVYDIPIPEIQISTDPAVVQRGEYLVYGPAHCVECHSVSRPQFQNDSDDDKPPLIGGMKFPDALLGAIYSKNLTPDRETGIGRYSDGQIARMMRWSVRPDGRASVRPLMPFQNMSQEDVVAIISYLRQQKPIRNRVPADKFTVIGKIVKSLSSTFKPRTAINPPSVSPAEEPTKERGEYLARDVANCGGCHTRLGDLTFEPIAPEFSGGEELAPLQAQGVDPAIWFRTPNLTPAKGSGLDKFPDQPTFIARFKVGGRHYPGSPMPWEEFQRMSTADIGALYEFFHSLSPRPGPIGEPTFRKTD